MEIPIRVSFFFSCHRSRFAFVWLCVGGVSHEYLLIKCAVGAGTSSFVRSNATKAASVTAIVAAVVTAACVAVCSAVGCTRLQWNSFEIKNGKKKMM